MFTLKAILSLACITAAAGYKLVISNDDGWAVAQIRAQYEALTDAGHNVILSAPAQNQSGAGSKSAPATPLEIPCQFDSCPVGSPPEGYDANNPRLNYVNSFPVDATDWGITTLSPYFFDGLVPDLLVSGPNIGNNLGLFTQLSGTIGAATAAVNLGIPAAAFSGASGSQVSYATLDSDPSATSTLAARLYSNLTVHVVQTLLDSPIATPVLPAGVLLNVNYPSFDNCPEQSDYKWVFARNVRNPLATDVWTCGSTHLPSETRVILTSGCYASISVLSAATKSDVSAIIQGAVLERLNALPFSCLP